MFSLIKNGYAKGVILATSAVTAGSAFLGNSFAYTVDPTTGFPVVEASDTSTMLSGVGSATGGMLAFITSEWKVIVAIIVAGAIVSFVYGLMNKTKSAVQGR